MENPGAIAALLLVAVAIIGALKYAKVQQDKRQTMRTTEELKAYRIMLLQSVDNELTEEDAAFVHTLFTPALRGQYEKRQRPIAAKLRRTDNEFQLRALGIELVARWQKENPDTPQHMMPPELRSVAEEEQCLAPEPKPIPRGKKNEA